MLCGDRQARLMRHRPGTIQDEGFLGIEREQRGLRRGKAGRIPDAVAEVGDLPCAPIVATVIFGSDDVVQHRSQLCAIHPQQHPRLREPLLNRAMIAVEGDTALWVGGTRNQGVGALVG